VDDYFRAVEVERKFIARIDVLSVGLDDRYIRRCIRSGLWIRVRNGAYHFRDTWAALTKVERHAVHTFAVLRSLGDAVVPSHQTGLNLLTCDVWGVDLSRVNVTRRDGRSGGIEGDVVHHAGAVSDDDLVEVNGILLMRPARSVLENAGMNGVEPGLVSADSALHRGLVTLDELREAQDSMAHWRGSRKVDLVVRMADGRSESVGETRSRYMFWRHGLPRPELQYRVHDCSGQLIGITDFGWPDHGLLGEFDGAVKYGRLLKPGQHPGEAVFAEKVREDDLRRETGCAMWRLIWDHLSAPATAVAHARRLMSK
jgi:hypothetical protein